MLETGLHRVTSRGSAPTGRERTKKFPQRFHDRAFYKGLRGLEFGLPGPQ